MTRKPLMPVDEARAHILAATSPLDSETVAIRASRGRVLAADIRARLTQPPFAASAMDGYAVRMADTLVCPVELRIIGETPAGSAPGPEIGPGEAIRIFTGAAIPPGADAIVIQENTRRDGDRVEILQAPEPGRHIRPAGLDFKDGDLIARRGERLAPALIGLLATADHPMVPVSRRPRVGILTSGDELVEPGAPRAPHQIVSSNSIALAALVEAAGGIAIDLGIARDRTDDIQARVKNAPKLDLLITSGGASVGDHDLVHSALSGIGLEVNFWRIAMRPGKPMMFGDLKGVPFLGLPGNPASALVCAHVFLIPLLRRLMGLLPEIPAQRLARLGSALKANDERQDYLRARLTEAEDGALIATPFPRQDSAMLSPFASADALLIRPVHAPAAEPGELVEILPLRIPADHLLA
ncbi:molybdopterin molybdotransferase MoeA [Govanella unica]|uniref:Molybdopterin molybdenumtransferase n=1 Tax=Govanella unica TaxID=2975056 RepID=A0A9X3Z750_9PROT|nr:gephyrin-like molybdotransferase Glp [Govania unica]MDA5193787.1 molybdopterin molybdotransferase MoeA [Govania unica]